MTGTTKIGISAYQQLCESALMKTFLSLGCLALLLLSGCATQYQKVGFSGGFIERQVSRNEFTVAFAGNGYTSGRRAIDLCLLRCAELTLGHGFHYFILTANNIGFDTSSSITIGNIVPTGGGGGVYVSSTQTIPKPSATNKILCFRGKPATTTEYYDAQQVFDELSHKYGVEKAVDTFAKPRLPRAAIGVSLKIVVPTVYTPRPGGGGMPPAQKERARLEIDAFTRGGLAKEAGLQIGDEIRACDGTAITNAEQLGEVSSHYEIGQTIQVTVRRHGNDIVVPVKTEFNRAWRFRPLKAIKCEKAVTADEVVLIEDARPTVDAYPVAEYTDWEAPVESDEEIRRYATSAASSYGVNGVLILNSQEQVRNMFPNENERVGFLCTLLIVPAARLGVEFETGTGYENRRVIRRVFNSQASASGLLIGDNVLAINGIDPVLNTSGQINDCLKWSVGQEVQVVVARDGKEVTVPVQTIANRP